MKKRKRFLRIDEMKVTTVPSRKGGTIYPKDSIRKKIKEIKQDSIRKEIEGIKQGIEQSQSTIMVTTPNGATRVVFVSDFYVQKRKEWSERLDKASSWEELKKIEEEIKALNF